jgi:hypothetical protein
VRDPSWLAGPGAFLVRHRLLYALSLAGAGGALVVFAARARRSRETWRRLGWGALAAGQGFQILGIWWARRRAAGRHG